MPESLQQIEDYIARLFDQRCYVTTIRMKRNVFRRLTSPLIVPEYSGRFRYTSRFDTYEMYTSCGNVKIKLIPDNA